MTHDERQPPDPVTRFDARPDLQLDAQLRALPVEVEPGRDLWPGIAARIAQAAAAPQPVTRRPAWAWQAVAALVLVAGSSLLTASLLDRSPQADLSASQAASAATAARRLRRPIRAVRACFPPRSVRQAGWTASTSWPVIS